MPMVLGSGLLTWPLARLLGYRTRTFVPPMMFSNSGNMGLPLMLFAFGERALPAAVVLFMVENLLHFSVGTRMVDARASLLGMFKVPILIASIAGLACSIGGIQPPLALSRPIGMVGQIAIPLMLFSLGVRLTSIDFSDWRMGVVGVAIGLSGLPGLVDLRGQPDLFGYELRITQVGAADELAKWAREVVEAAKVAGEGDLSTEGAPPPSPDDSLPSGGIVPRRVA